MGGGSKSSAKPKQQALNVPSQQYMLAMTRHGQNSLNLLARGSRQWQGSLESWPKEFGPWLTRVWRNRGPYNGLSREAALALLAALPGARLRRNLVALNAAVAAGVSAGCGAEVLRSAKEDALEASLSLSPPIWSLGMKPQTRESIRVHSKGWTQRKKRSRNKRF